MVHQYHLIFYLFHRLLPIKKIKLFIKKFEQLLEIAPHLELNLFVQAMLV